MSNASTRNGLRIAVLGYVVRGPLGGLVWHHLQYVTGLLALGHEVFFVEDSDDYPSCYDPARGVVDGDPSYGLRFAADVFEWAGVGARWAYYDSARREWLGAGAGRARSFCETADLVLNLSGVNPLRPWLDRVPARALVDTDPVFTQIRHLSDPAAMELALGHTAFFTYGENVGRPGCSTPDDGLPWVPTRQPVVLDAWEVTPGPSEGRFTTVMQWDSYAAGTIGGRTFGMKSASFEPYLDLPSATGEALELAVGSASAPRALLRRHGWRVRNPLVPTRTARSYQRYLRASKGEFSVAKHGYAVSRCGWFSERTAAYLASGRPAVVQDTGFSERLECGLGVLAFATPDEAAAALDDVSAAYTQHCAAARDVAHAYFDARIVLPVLVESAMTSTRTTGATS
jgi:hypothetical protein